MTLMNANPPAMCHQDFLRRVNLQAAIGAPVGDHAQAVVVAVAAVVEVQAVLAGRADQVLTQGVNPGNSRDRLTTSVSA